MYSGKVHFLALETLGTKIRRVKSEPIVFIQFFLILYFRARRNVIAKSTRFYFEQMMTCIL